jgi:transposase
VSWAKRFAALEARVEQAEARAEKAEARAAKAEAEVERLTKRIGELEAELGKNSRNSSKPPSTDSPKDKEARPARESSGRNPGGQPGHKGSQRSLLPPERVTRTRPHFPCVCGNPDCRAKLPKTPAGEPLREQTIEVPKIVPDVTEDQWHSVRCPNCQHVTQAKPKGRQRGMCGPNLIAIITLLVGVYHLSRRQAATCVGDLLGIDLSLGLVSKLEKKVGAMLEPAHAEAARAVQRAPAKNLDATPWLRAGASETLWVIASKTAVVFHIVSNGTQALLEPLMGTLKGILMSDRGSQFGFWAMDRRQICWAHLIRKFVSYGEHRDPRVQDVAGKLVLLTQTMFSAWHRVRDGTDTLASFQGFVENLRPVIEGHLEGLEALGVNGVSGSCTDILKHRDALWTFAYARGVEPTNNHAEQLVRAFVLWRKKTFGSRSERGDRFAERVMTVVETCRKRERHVLSFLRDTIEASLSGKPAPTLMLNP